MSKTRITAPVAGFTGRGPGGVPFADGVAHTDDEAVIAYCRAAGYGVGKDDPTPPAAPEVADPRQLDGDGVVTVGTRLRDAAVDPADVDFLPPTNAGLDNPHGPRVVGPEIHDTLTQVVRPGPVHSDLQEQQTAETRHAERLLVEQRDVGDVTPPITDPDAQKGPLGLSDPGSVQPPRGGDAAHPAGSFDPGEHTVQEVRAHLKDADRAERDRVLALEAAGKARLSLLEQA